MKIFTEFKKLIPNNKLGVISHPCNNSVIEPNILKCLNYKMQFSLRKCNLIYWNMLKQLYISSDDMFKFLKGGVSYRESMTALMVRVLRENVAKNV